MKSRKRDREDLGDQGDDDYDEEYIKRCKRLMKTGLSYEDKRFLTVSKFDLLRQRWGWDQDKNHTKYEESLHTNNRNIYHLVHYTDILMWFFDKFYTGDPELAEINILNKITVPENLDEVFNKQQREQSVELIKAFLNTDNTRLLVSKLASFQGDSLVMYCLSLGAQALINISQGDFDMAYKNIEDAKRCCDIKYDKSDKSYGGKRTRKSRRRTKRTRRIKKSIKRTRKRTRRRTRPKRKIQSRIKPRRRVVKK